MTTSRYSRTPILGFGEKIGTSATIALIRSAVQNGVIPYRETVLRGYQRLDTLAGELYGDAQYWWVLAAASDIGWGLQVPPGTLIRVPVLDDALKLLG
jgi:hypothetical protein